jgi:hypothetical protein
LKAWAVVTYPSDIKEHWFVPRHENRRWPDAQYWASVGQPEVAAEDYWSIPVFFCDTENVADAIMHEVLKHHPNKTVLKLKTTEVAKVQIGPVQKATLSDAGLLPV